MTDPTVLPSLAIGRVGSAGRERPVVVVDGTAFDASRVTEDIDPAFLDRGGLPALIAAARAGALDPLDIAGQRVGAPIAWPRKVVCIGLNYRAHAVEAGMDPPVEPVVFMKDPGCVVGPTDDLLIPRGSSRTDWEVELAVVIGRTARYLEDPSEARSHIAGYAVSNDVSERELQIERGGGQWDKGKSCETFNPLGPWMVPVEGLEDPQALGIRLWVNGELRQSSSTADMIFGVDHLVWALSRHMVLRPGDVVNTGTPAGVALGSADQRYLRSGDLVEAEIDGLGRQVQRCVDA